MFPSNFQNSDNICKQKFPIIYSFP